ncbi:peptidase domain-containing ABC transporter [Aureispira anguillae]|uniref:Peptidase domain-containing ABC transporter n=1 Tax=Aureispira anguillae TaxID=2864201 RepID=A0A916DX18_9BACT|nr:peptidase domain-containing ABC transporter [Aureispira anguillae]BDS15417.1 peptidase domain-containing ABC transporter [Aureispira anguillae]
MPVKFPFYKQLDTMDCGPTCLKMIAQSDGKSLPLQYLREKCYITREGVSLLGITEAAESIGYRTIAVKITYEQEGEIPGLLQFPLPCIAYWEQRHFVVVYKISKTHVWVADPAEGKIKLKRSFFEKGWLNNGQKGIALGLEATPAFYQEEGLQEDRSKWRYLLGYLKPYKQLIFQFVLGMMVGLIFQLMLPFLTQSLIDVGVNNQNIGFVWLILIAQLVLSVSQVFVQFIQSWIALNIGRRVNVNLIADFLAKMMQLPLGFFDTKNIGDLYQRISDNHRVESFLTGSILNMLFSIVTVMVFSVILFMYNRLIFVVFFAFSTLYLLWIWGFLKWRKELDYMAFQQSSENQQTLYEIINGVQEIKLQGSERKRRWKWVEIQAKLFSVQTKSLALRQYQEFGGLLFSRLKDILISFIAASAVINGEMTLGMMVAVQYIVGQLNAPFQQFIGFVYSAQDAKISLERMGEITSQEDENASNIKLIKQLPDQINLELENLSFGYTPISNPILQNINLTIPKGKTTAIVGASGSGKTTLLKLLLGFYEPLKGKILVGKNPLSSIDKRYWRSLCGTVMQDGFIFSDTIAHNIAESDTSIDYQKLHHAIEVANIGDLIETLPLGYNTVIGAQGNGISQGQKQRILIARAVYKNPDVLFLDEATNALDATNERKIVESLNHFLTSKTVVVVAHRLSTIINADQIVVLDNGKIVEQGTHSTLLNKKGEYYRLVQNQLDVEQVGANVG